MALVHKAGKRAPVGENSDELWGHRNRYATGHGDTKTSVPTEGLGQCPVECG